MCTTGLTGAALLCIYLQQHISRESLGLGQSTAQIHSALDLNSKLILHPVINNPQAFRSEEKEHTQVAQLL